MLEAKDAEIVESVLREVLPNLCATVGRANVRDIARTGGDFHLVSMEGASRRDWALFLTMLAAAATIVSNGLAIIRNISEQKNKSQSEISIEMKLSIPPQMAAKLDKDDVDKLVGSLIKRF